MAVLYRVNTALADRHEQMMERLYHEWQAQQTGSSEPLIIEESPNNGDRPNHLYVVWSEWSDLSPLERSKIIMQAYEKYKGRDIALSVTLALGLSPEEARQMKIEL